MELSYDWRNFQNLFHLRKRNGEAASPIYLVSESHTVISAFSPGEDLSDWVGATVDELIAEFPNRELLFFDRKKVDQWLQSSLEMKHFYNQSRFLKSVAVPHQTTRGRGRHSEILAPHHFLLSASQSWWRKVLPSRYGVYLSIRNPVGGVQTLILLYRRGELESFHVPDLSGMIPERRKHSGDVVRFLAEHYLVPVQGIFLTLEEWVRWSENSNPWKEIFSALKKDRSRLMPLRWGLFGLIALRAFFGI